MSRSPSEDVPRNYVAHRNSGEEHVRPHVIHSQSVTVIMLDGDPGKHEPVVRPGVDHVGRQEPQQQIDRQTDQPYEHESNWWCLRHAERGSSAAGSRGLQMNRSLSLLLSQYSGVAAATWLGHSSSFSNAPTLRFTCISTNNVPVANLRRVARRFGATLRAFTETLATRPKPVRAHPALLPPALKCNPLIRITIRKTDTLS